jgi:hypothetical protein
LSRSITGFLVVAALLALPFLSWTAWDRWNDGETEQIAQDLPRYPGARLIRKSEKGARPIWLTFVVSKPVGFGDVERFYARRIAPDWRRPSDECPGFTRGEALVLVRRDAFDAHVIRAVVDARGKGDCDQLASVIVS